MKAKSSIKILGIILFACALFGVNPAVFAHTHLHSSEPAAGAELTAAPETLTLVFDGEVNLVSLKLKQDGGSDVALGFRPSAQKAETFSIALPNLAPGAYTLHWSAIGEDGHLVQGDVPFSVSTSR